MGRSVPDGTAHDAVAVAHAGRTSADMTDMADMAIMVVRVDEQRVGFVASDVVEVQRMVAWEPLPGAPEAVDGVIDLRGHVVPVLDLKERFGLPSRPPGVDDHLVVVRAGRHVVAVRVDQALALQTIPAGGLLPMEEVAPGGARVAGVVRSDGSLLVVADLGAFLGWDEAAGLDRALSDRSQHDG